jgi:hypothetical protein
VTDPTPDQAALDTAQALTVALDGMGRQLRAVNERQDRADRFSHRSRIIILITVVSLIIDLAITGLYINNSIRLDRATTALNATTMELQHTRATVAEVHQTLISGCQGGNVTKAGQIQIWRKLASLSPPAAGTPPSVAADQEKRVQAFLAFVAKINAPRDCAAVYKLPGGKP